MAASASAEPPAARGVPAVATIVVSGDEDPVLALQGQSELATTWAAELVVLRGGGHLLAWEQPQRVAWAIERFLTERAARHRS